MAEKIVKSRQASQDIRPLGLQLYRPDKSLEAVVHSMWTADAPDRRDAAQFRVANDCGSGWIFNFGGDLTFRIRDRRYRFGRMGILTGPSRYVCEFGFEGRISVLGVRFLPGAGHRFIGRPMAAYRDALLPLQNVNLYRSLAEVGLEHAIDLLECELTLHVDENTDSDQDLLDRFLTGLHSGDFSNIEYAVSELGLSLRTAQRLFHRLIGINPSAYFQCLRVRRAREAVQDSRAESLTDLAYDLGYFDQAHFIKEFRSMVEESPSTYARFKRAPGMGH